jgi:DNA-binding response OmpR family regulator
MEALHQRLNQYTLLIAEDDESTLKWLVKVLSIYFKEVKGASDAIEALELFHQSNTDIVLADIQMPKLDGLSFLEKIANISPQSLRIVMTAFNNPAYLNKALESQVSFYLKKPIDIDELLIAIASNVKQTKKDSSSFPLEKNYIYNSLTKCIEIDDKNIQLTKKETLILELLLKNQNSIVSIDTIQNEIWNEEVTLDAIRMVIVGLRKKLYKDALETVKGHGYKLNI